jgi:hypothetical protein
MKEMPLTELQKKKYVALYTEKNRVQTEINELSTFIMDANGVELKDQACSLDLEKGILTIKDKE